jgi:ABC-type glycerol-3-phosphate transport system substrate-binding protein
MKRRSISIAISFGLLLAAPLVAAAEELTVWHAYGDQGLNTLQQIADTYSHDHSSLAVKSVSMSREQWLARSIAALSTSTAPDIIFYDNDLMVQVEKNTGKLTDLTPALNALPPDARGFVSDGDVGGSSFGKKLIMMPVNRAIVGLGARKSWLAEVGETFPKTWDDFLRVAEKFKKAKGGYPIGLHAGTPAAITYAGIDLFAYGNGAPHTQVDENGDIIIDQPYVATPLIGYLKLFTQYKLLIRPLNT